MVWRLCVVCARCWSHVAFLAPFRPVVIIITTQIAHSAQQTHSARLHSIHRRTSLMFYSLSVATFSSHVDRQSPVYTMFYPESGVRKSRVCSFRLPQTATFTLSALSGRGTREGASCPFLSLTPLLHMM